MNARQKAKRYKALYEMVVKKPIPVVFRTSTQPTTTLKASMLVSPEEMDAGIPFKAILARKFVENLEDYMTITSERDNVTTLYPGGSMSNTYIRLTGTIEIVGGKE
jgi:hypothetical protein